MFFVVQIRNRKVLHQFHSFQMCAAHVEEGQTIVGPCSEEELEALLKPPIVKALVDYFNEDIDRLAA